MPDSFASDDFASSIREASNSIQGLTEQGRGTSEALREIAQALKASRQGILTTPGMHASEQFGEAAIVAFALQHKPSPAAQAGPPPIPTPASPPRSPAVPDFRRTPPQMEEFRGPDGEMRTAPRPVASSAMDRSISEMLARRSYQNDIRAITQSLFGGTGAATPPPLPPGGGVPTAGPGGIGGGGPPIAVGVAAGSAAGGGGLGGALKPLAAAELGLDLVNKVANLGDKLIRPGQTSIGSGLAIQNKMDIEGVDQQSDTFGRSGTRTIGGVIGDALNKEDMTLLDLARGTISPKLMRDTANWLWGGKEVGN